MPGSRDSDLAVVTPHRSGDADTSAPAEPGKAAAAPGPGSASESSAAAEEGAHAGDAQGTSEPEPESPSDTRPKDRVRFHKAIGIAAFKRRYVTSEQFADALLAAARAPQASPHSLWVGGGFLDETEFAEVHGVVLSSTAGDGEVRRILGIAKARQAALPADGSADDSEDSSRSFTIADVIKTHGFGKPLQLDRPATDEEPLAAGTEAGMAVQSLSGLPNQGTERYLLGGELGRGGVGRVIKAFDRDLGRTVALKLPLEWPQPKENVEKFIEEAQATGQLEHPNIVPVYDVGVLSTGEIYYTMKRVRSHSLRDVINGLIEGAEEISREYGPTRLLNVFLQVCQAIHYAHSRGVIHRDLKPDNIMLGNYGEVHVMDWGLARILDKHVVTDRSLRGAERIESGQTVGTPAYMPPEQAQGLLDRVDERSDVYSLGVILYELATLKQPSTRATVMETLMAVIAEPIIPPRKVAPERAISEEMEFIIMKAVDKDKSRRWQSAKELHDAVERFLDGRNDREAERRCEDGDRYMRMYEQARAELKRLEDDVRDLAARTQDWDPIELKRPLWALEDRRRDTATRMIRTFGESMREYSQALAHIPGHPRALRSLSQLIWNRYKTAERENNELDQLYYESLLRNYDDGTFLSRIYDHAPVTVETNPPGASVFRYAYEERDRTLQLGEPEYLGETPLRDQHFERGNYLLRIKHPRFPAVNLPFRVNRSDAQAIHVDLPARELYRPDFVYVPGGVSIIGGDPDAFDPLTLRRVQIPSFFIQRYPVTFREYLEFLNELASVDHDLAFERSPRTRDADGLLAILGADGRYVPSPVLIEGPMRGLYPEGEGHEQNLPVLAIRVEDALAYAEWRSSRDGVRFRLPGELEWERAARGADGRYFPWGNRFDATLCKMKGSRPLHSQPEPVGTYHTDCSPFEVYDLAGGVREWVESDANDAIESVVRGGCWSVDSRACRAASRYRYLRDGRSSTIGFRLAYSPQDAHPRAPVARRTIVDDSEQ